MGIKTYKSNVSVPKKAISEGQGAAALFLLKAGAETDKKTVDGYLAIDMAPDAKVRRDPTPWR